MKKLLTPEHVSAYVNHSVDVYGASQVFKLTGMDISNKNSNEFTLYMQMDSVEFEGSSLEHSLILRPLPDLIKEIEFNGEKFIPLKKLHELNITNAFFNNNYQVKFTDNVISIEHFVSKFDGKEQEFILKYHFNLFSTNKTIHSFRYDPRLMRFLIRDDTGKRSYGVGHQWQLFQKLLEWNFDVFQLIGTGAAVDINDFNTES